MSPDDISTIAQHLSEIKHLCYVMSGFYIGRLLAKLI